MPVYEINALTRLAHEQVTSGQMDTARLKQMEELILKNGTIDHHEVAILRDMIRQTRTGTPHKVRRAEIEFLFTLNDSTLGQRNDASWQPFFIEAVSEHLFNRSTSGMEELDEPEALWLIEMIEKNCHYDANEIALLEHLHTRTRHLPMSIRFRMGVLAISNHAESAVA